MTPSEPARKELVLYLLARLCAAIGVQIQSLAIAWQVYERTGRAIDLGWVGFAQFFPLAVFSLTAGKVADRYNRKWILGGCRLGYAVGAMTLAAVSTNPTLGLTPIYTVLVILGTLRAFAWPSSVALLPSTVANRNLPRAIAMNSTVFQAATIAGPALGGLLYASIGPGWTYGTTCILEILSVVLLCFVRPRQIPRTKNEREESNKLLAGLKFVWTNKTLLGATSLDLAAVLLGGAVALMPIYASDILHVGETGLGMLRSAPAIGAALVAVLFSWRPMRSRIGPAMFIAVGIFGVATIAFGLSRNFMFSLGVLAILGAADMVSVVVRQSLVQVRTPDAMRGRVAAVNMVFISASNELGEFESGITAAVWGVVPAVVIGGVGTLVVTVIWALLFPTLRRADQLTSEPASNIVPSKKPT